MMKAKIKLALPLLLSGVMALSATHAGWQLANGAPPAGKAAPAQAEQKKEQPAKADNKPATPAPVPATALPVAPLDLLQDPDRFMNKTVVFEGTFNRFADIGLDYKKAFRDSKDYVSFFILRPDVVGHSIPLSELKLFYPRKKSDEVMDLESGDRVRVVGTQFSNALGEPWLDVDSITILQKTATSEKRQEAPEL